MIVRHTEEQVSDYYERIGLNQSSLKVILEDGIQTYAMQVEQLTKQDDYYYEEKKHFIIGSAVDCRITHGEEVFLNKYHFSKLVKKPSDGAMSVIKLAYDKAREEFPLGVDVSLEAYRKQVFEAANEEGYYMNRRNKENNWELDTRISELLKQNGQAYWADLALAEGKQVLSDEEQTIINSVIISLTTHKHTAHLFKDSENIDIVFQFPMFFTVKDVDCKGMIDMIIIDHTRKKIMPIDIKTTMKLVLRFNDVIKRRRYDLQASFYTEGLKQSLTQLGSLLDKDVTKYEIAKFAFIAESTTKSGCPMVFVLQEDILLRGEKGNVDEQVEGWQQGVDKYKSWAEAGFSIEKKYGETNGVIFINSSTLNSVI